MLSSKFRNIIPLIVFSLGFLFVFENIYPIIDKNPINQTDISIEKESKREPIEGSVIIDYSLAPANLTAIAVEKNFLKIPVINITSAYFQTQWERIFKKTLPILSLDSDQNQFGLNATDFALINGSLLIGTTIDLINASWITPTADNETIIMYWSNLTYGTGWAIYGGSIEATKQALTFHANTLDTIEHWFITERVTPRFPFLLGNYRSFNDALNMDPQVACLDFENTLIGLVQKSFSAVQMFIQFEDLANISLNGYEEPNHNERYRNATSLLQSFFDIAANYSIEIYLYTDEVVFTQAQFNWVMSNLQYDGPSDDCTENELPNHLSGAAPGFWQFLEAKYNALVETLSILVNPQNKAGFGGFYFRTDDLANPYPYKFSLFRNDTSFSRFINITVAAAKSLNATVIQRMWRLGGEENVFNNATLAKRLLDPIQADNLILRCKETWNDHWYGHPPNPVIGVSHHKWIIGWYTGAAMPDYKGPFFDMLFTEGNWQDNPNVIGYDFGTLAYASFERFDYQPFFSANNHHLYLKRWNGKLMGNDTLRKYLHQVGFIDESTVDQLIIVFNLCHYAFKELSFWEAWTSTGKFTGDILNGGNTIVFEPGRFNNFYKKFQTSGFTNKEIIEEGFRAMRNAELAFSLLPSGVPGFGEMPFITKKYLDPEYATADPENMTLQLMTLRGNLRQFQDLAQIFANYKAWHISYYEWTFTGSLRAYLESEGYRKHTMSLYNAYQEIWGDSHFWYKTDFRTMRDFWIPTVGELDSIRIQLIFPLICILLLAGCLLILYRPSMLKSIQLKVFRRNKKINNNPFIEWPSPAIQFTLLFFNYIIIPILLALAYWGIFNAVGNNLYPLFPHLMWIVGLSIGLGYSMSILITSLLNSKDKDILEKNLLLCGALSWGSVLILSVLFIIFMMGGVIAIASGIVNIIFIGMTVLCGISISYLIVIRNIQCRWWFKYIIFPILCIGLIVCFMWIFTTAWGGFINALDLALGSLI
jgi:hypothetical protein